MVKSLRVMLWGVEVGRLAWDGRRRLSYFTYNPDFIRRGLDIAPFVAPIGSVRALAPVWGEESRIYQKLPAFVADSLPDAWGSQLFELWRQQNHLANADITPLDKLSFIGYYPYTTTFGAGYSSSDPYGIALLSGSDDAGLPQFEFTVKNDVDEQVDFLISDLLTNLPNGTSAVSPSSASDREHLTIVDKVRLLFHHATSKVTIRIAVDDAIREDFMSMTISNLQLTNIWRKGTVTPSYAPATGTTIDVTEDKTDPEHYQTTYTIVKADPDPEKTINHIKDCCLMLPQTLAYVENDAANTANLNITYSVTLRSHSTVYTYDGAGNPVETDHYTYSNTASLPLAEMKMASAPTTPITKWLPNHHYIYTLRLGANRIEFTGEVVEWGQEVEWDNIIVDQIGGS